MAEFYLIEGKVFDHVEDYSIFLDNLRLKNPNTNWVVIAVYKDFKKGIINHFIAQYDNKGDIGFYVRVYKEQYKDSLKPLDYYYGNEYLPGEDEIYRMLEKGIVI